MDNIYDNFTEPEKLYEQLNVLNGSVGLLLNEFKKAFVLSRMYPENQEVQQQFSNMENQMNTIRSKMFTTLNEVEVNIDELNKELLKLNVEIKKERRQNVVLKKKLGMLENESNAASEMINDYNLIYDQRYLRNWALGLSALLCFATIGIVFKKQEV
jgi:chromosome segregation ATPase